MGFFSFLFGTTKSSESLPFEGNIKFNRIKSEYEIEIGKELARQEGKPEDMLEKIALGKLNKFFKENTLLAQAFVKDNSLSVEGYLKSMDKDLTVTDFKHIKLG